MSKQKKKEEYPLGRFYLKSLDELVESSSGGRFLVGGEVGAHLPEAGQELRLAPHVHLPPLDHRVAHLEKKKDCRRLICR